MTGCGEIDPEPRRDSSLLNSWSSAARMTPWSVVEPLRGPWLSYLTDAVRAALRRLSPVADPLDGTGQGPPGTPLRRCTAPPCPTWCPHVGCGALGRDCHGPVEDRDRGGRVRRLPRRTRLVAAVAWSCRNRADQPDGLLPVPAAAAGGRRRRDRSAPGGGLPARDPARRPPGPRGG